MGAVHNAASWVTLFRRRIVMSSLLKLKAIDADDLLVISALVQDGVVPPAELHFDPAKGSFTAMVTRYCWEKEACKASGRVPQRVLSLLSIDGVSQVKSRGVAMPHPGQAQPADGPPLAVLAVIWRDGWVMLHFAEEAALALKADSLSVRLADLCEPWCAKARPSHPLDETADFPDPPAQETQR